MKTRDIKTTDSAQPEEENTTKKSTQPSPTRTRTPRAPRASKPTVDTTSEESENSSKILSSDRPTEQPMDDYPLQERKDIIHSQQQYRDDYNRPSQQPYSQNNQYQNNSSYE